MKAAIEKLEIRPNVILRKGMRVWIVLDKNLNSIISREISEITYDDSFNDTNDDLIQFDEVSPFTIEVVSSTGFFVKYSDITLKDKVFTNYEDAKKYATS